MTTLPLTFAINTILNQIHVFSVNMPLATNALASNISFVEWDGVTGVGKITYNDRMFLSEQFTDPSPYQTYVNQWMTAAAVALPTPLTLVEARAIKSSLVDSVWSGKRQAPVSVATSLGTFSFDANDTLSSSLNNGAILSAIAAIISQFGLEETAITNLKTAITSASTTMAGAINSYTSTLASQTSADMAMVDTYWSATSAGFSMPNASLPASSIGGFSGVAFTPPTALPTLTAPVKMLPVGSTSYPAFTVADLFAVISAVQTQRNNEAAARAVKQAAIAALNTVAAVISYDATTGW